jgi:hypothetical protein
MDVFGSAVVLLKYQVGAAAWNRWDGRIYMWFGMSLDIHKATAVLSTTKSKISLTAIVLKQTVFLLLLTWPWKIYVWHVFFMDVLVCRHRRLFSQDLFRHMYSSLTSELMHTLGTLNHQIQEDKANRRLRTSVAEQCHFPRFRFRFSVPKFVSAGPVPAPVLAPVPTHKCSPIGKTRFLWFWTVLEYTPISENPADYKAKGKKIQK